MKLKSLFLILAMATSLEMFAAGRGYFVTVNLKQSEFSVGGASANDEVAYAFVWSPIGATFGGFRADGEPVSAKDKVLGRSTFTKDSLTQGIEISDDVVQALGLDGNGVFRVVLIDDRDLDGKRPTSFKGFDRWRIVREINAADCFVSSNYASEALPRGISEVPSAYQDKMPRIVKFDGEKHEVCVKDTSEFLIYDVVVSDTLEGFKNGTAKRLGKRQRGQEAKEITFNVSAEEDAVEEKKVKQRFYKVIRSVNGEDK